MNALEKIPIDINILKKRNAIPTLIAKLSYLDEVEAIECMRLWGERKMPVTPLYELLEGKVNAHEIQT